MTGPIRVLELRSVRGTGGGPEKTILHGAARTDPGRIRITVAYIRDCRDEVFGIDAWAARLGIDYVEIKERHSFDPSVWRQLCALIRARQIQIVHAHDYKTNLLALLLAQQTGVTPMTTEHGWTGHALRERAIYYKADKWLARFFPCVLAVSEDIRQELLRHGAKPARVTTVLNGIDPEAFRRQPGRQNAMRTSLGLSARDVVIGATGRLEPQKRFDLLLDAVARLKPLHPQIRLVIAGEGSQRAVLEQLATRLELNATCTFVGFRRDVADLHHAFDLFVQSSDYEGTPNAVLEAMALETPIVATDAGGTRQLMEDGVHGLIVPVGDVPALAGAMGRALSDSAACAQWTRHARARVERDLSFDRRVATVERIYENLLEGPAAQSAPPVLPVNHRPLRMEVR